MFGRKLTAGNITMMSSRAPAAVSLIRFAAGGVFLFEGIQKFLFPMEMGPGLFAKLGIPAPGLLAPLAGLIEAFRWSLLGHERVHWGFVVYASACAIAVLLIGMVSFKRMERKFADII